MTSARSDTETWDSERNKDGNNSRYEAEFFAILRDCIIRTLKDLVGESATAAVLRKLGLVEPGFSPSSLHDKLAFVFGEPTIVIEMVIAKELSAILGMKFAVAPDFGMEEFLERAKKISYERSALLKRKL